MKARLYAGILFAGDVIIFYLSLAAVLFLRHPHEFSFEQYLGHASFFSVLLPLFLGINFILSLYNFRQIRDLQAIIGESLLAFFYNLLASSTLLYLLASPVHSPKTRLFFTLLLYFVLGVYWRRLWMRLSTSKIFAVKTVFLGDTPLINRMVAELKSHPYSRFRLIDLRTLERWRRKNLNQLRGQAQGGSPLSAFVDLIVVDDEQAGLDDAAREMISAATAAGIPVQTHIDFYEETYKKIPAFAARRSGWLFTHVRQNSGSGYALFKRVFDMAAALLLLSMVLPFLPLVALAIKLSDGGRVFYSQIRVGYLQKRFLFWKLRTMHENAERLGYIWNTASGDPRVTRVGALLRKYRIDEFPQLWNVLKGDMSLVGPRPTWVGETQALDMPDYHMRFLVPPGLTGWAQINSSATDSQDDTMEKLCYDFYYIKNMSFALDISILLKTLRRIFQSDHALRKKRRATPLKTDLELPVSS